MPKHRDPGPALRPVAAPRNLTREIAERLADHIASAKLMPGTKLPTEQEIEPWFEAVCALWDSPAQYDAIAAQQRDARSRHPGRSHFQKR